MSKLAARRKQGEGTLADVAANIAPPVNTVNDDSAKLYGQSAKAPDISELDVAEIGNNPNQVRTEFDEEEITHLANSIRDNGQLMPIVVRINDEGGYELVAGERRLRAHKLLKKPTIFAIVTQSTTSPRTLSLIENVQRVQLNCLELASGLRQLIDEGGYTQRKAAEIVGMNENSVTKQLGVLALPEDILSEYPKYAEIISRSTLIELADIKDETVLRSLWERAKEGALSRTDIRNAMRAISKPKKQSVADGNTLKLLVSSINKINAHVDTISNVREHLAPDHVKMLEALRARIDELLGR